jgi:transposase-like protein
LPFQWVTVFDVIASKSLKSMKNPQANSDCPQATAAILSLKQHYAIELLLIGKSDVEIAELVGVESNIIWQWRNQNPEFIIATSALRAAAWSGSVERLKRLMEQALDVVEKAVARDDEIAAITLLQALGWQRDHH